MGYSILMQWTLAPSSGGRMGISDLVLSRVLEHYNISHPMRSTIQLRTFRATFPVEDAAPGAPTSVTRLLTTVTHSMPLPHSREVPITTTARDNVTYLFLEDRGVPVPPGAAREGSKDEEKRGDKEGKEEGKEGKEDKGKDDKEKDESKTNGKAEDKDEKPKIDDVDGSKKDADAGDQKNGDKEDTKDAKDAKDAKDESMAVDEVPASAPSRTPSKYKILAVKPATSVMPTLHQLLSPFVLGLSKASRAAASTTAQPPAPSMLQGTPLMITTLTFPPMQHPQPAISLSVHILPSANAQCIYLEAEWDASASVATSRAVLREFLLGCVPLDMAGEPRFMYWEDSGAPGAALDAQDAKDAEVEAAEWFGIEKTRRITFLLAKAMRENQQI